MLIKARWSSTTGLSLVLVKSTTLLVVLWCSSWIWMSLLVNAETSRGWPLLKLLNRCMARIVPWLLIEIRCWGLWLLAITQDLTFLFGFLKNLLLDLMQSFVSKRGRGVLIWTAYASKVALRSTEMIVLTHSLCEIATDKPRLQLHVYVSFVANWRSALSSACQSLTWCIAHRLDRIVQHFCCLSQ